MNPKNEKCVMIINQNLPAGVAANTAAIMGISLGKQKPQIVGPDVADKNGRYRPGIIEFPVPILKGSSENMQEIYRKLLLPEFSSLTAIDFTDLAQGCKTYEDFIEKMSKSPVDSLQYLGLTLCGPKKKVNKLTGNLPLLR